MRFMLAVACLAVSTLSLAQANIRGVVSGPKGPEAGVWVIAETTDLPTKFARIVVTDEKGRYLVPDLPNANYSVWVRGYGLVDSPKVESAPGRILDLKAVVAPNAAAAAHYYPAIYWYSMMKVPQASEVANLPGGVNQYLASVKNLSWHEQKNHSCGFFTMPALTGLAMM